MYLDFPKEFNKIHYVTLANKFGTCGISELNGFTDQVDGHFGHLFSFDQKPQQSAITDSTLASIFVTFKLTYATNLCLKFSKFMCDTKLCSVI